MYEPKVQRTIAIVIGTVCIALIAFLIITVTTGITAQRDGAIARYEVCALSDDIVRCLGN